MVELVKAPWAKVVSVPHVLEDVVEEYAKAHHMDDLLASMDTPLGRMYNDLLNNHADPDNNEDADILAELSGRMCYRAFGKGRRSSEAYLNHVIEDRHGNVFIHPNFSIIITGVSRGLTHQLVRHHVGSGPSQESQRFVTAIGDEGEFTPLAYQKTRAVVPPLLMHIIETEKKAADPSDPIHRDDYIHPLLKQFEDEFSQAIEIYDRRRLSFKAHVEASFPESQKSFFKKRANEAARGYLPQDTETRLMWTTNVRAAFNLFDRRGNIHADLEIRRLTVMLLKEIKKYAPKSFASFDVFIDEDGFESIKVPAVGI